MNTLRSLFVSALILNALCLLAEPIPVGYYNECQGKKDSALMAALHDTICGGTRYHYGTWGQARDPERPAVVIPDSFYMGTWSFFPLTDRQEDGSIWDMYSNNHRFFPQVAGESACGLQIEHCLPKSWWGADNTPEGKRAYQDLYNLNPADASANLNKSNYPPGEVQKGDKCNNGVFKMDSKASSKYGWVCYEPADCYKGDFARAYLYIATAYAHVPWIETYSDYVTNDSYLRLQPWLAELLVKWNRLDPVSEKELKRADIISSAQHNRNPFIDYPELVEYIWGDKKGEAVDFSQLLCTQDPTYQPKAENNTLEISDAKDVHSDYFEVSWNDFYAGPYILEVYSQRETTGTYDTILSFPALSKNIINSKANCMASDGTQAQGTQAILMGSGSTDSYILLSKLNLEKDCILKFRASRYANATAAQIDIYLDEHSKADTSINNIRYDEITYTYRLPRGTESVRIQSVGGSTKKRACMQELYILTGDRKEIVAYKPGFPVTTNNTNYAVHLNASPNERLIYRVKTAGGWVSKEKEVVLGTSAKQYAITTECEHGTIQGGGDFNYQQTATLTVSADEHYHFLKWSDGNQDNPRQIQVTKAATYQAICTIDTFQVHTTITNGTIEGGGKYTYGSTATLKVKPKLGYLFTEWTDGDTSNPRQIVVIQDTTLEATIIKDESNCTLTVHFTQGSVQLNGAKIVSDSAYTFPRHTSVELKAGSEPGHTFNGWSDGYVNTTRILVLTQDTLLATNYKIKSYEITTKIDGVGGSVTGGGSYEYNSLVTLTAVPEKGYIFQEWTDGNMDNPRQIKVTNSTTKNTYTARFQKENTGFEDLVMTNSDKAQKVVYQGHLYIYRQGQWFDALGLPLAR